MARKRTTIPTNSQDPRAERSRNALAQSLLRLLEDKPLETISIKEITDGAGLSHMTFFRRFASKEDLFKHIATQEVRSLLGLGQQTMETNAALSSLALCTYIEQRRGLWRTLLTGGADTVMRQEFMRISLEIASQRRVNPWLPAELAASFVSSGIFEIFAWWLRQPDDYPTENIVRIFDALIVDTLGKRRNLNLVSYETET